MNHTTARVRDRKGLDGLFRPSDAARMHGRRRATLTVLLVCFAAACGGSAGGGNAGGGNPGGPVAIAGLTAADVKLNLENRGFTCTGPGGGASVNYACTSSGYQVFFSGPGVTSIASVNAVALGDDSAAREFLGYVATLPYDGADPTKARSWVDANVGTNATTTIGNAKFTLGGPSGGRTLDITGG